MLRISKLNSKFTHARIKEKIIMCYVQFCKFFILFCFFFFKGKGKSPYKDLLKIPWKRDISYINLNMQINKIWIKIKDVSISFKSQFVLSKRICHIIRLSENTHPSKQTFTNYEIFYQLQQLKATELADNILQSCKLHTWNYIQHLTLKNLLTMQF